MPPGTHPSAGLTAGLAGEQHQVVYLEKLGDGIKGNGGTKSKRLLLLQSVARTPIMVNLKSVKKVHPDPNSATNLLYDFGQVIPPSPSGPLSSALKHAELNAASLAPALCNVMTGDRCWARKLEWLLRKRATRDLSQSVVVLAFLCRLTAQKCGHADW